MKAFPLVALFTSLATFSAGSQAACALAAIMGAPALPASDTNNLERLADLRDSVDSYLTSASARLESCTGSDPFVYNYAVDRLEDYASAFNALAQRHNTQIIASN